MKSLVVFQTKIIVLKIFKDSPAFVVSLQYLIFSISVTELTYTIFFFFLMGGETYNKLSYFTIHFRLRLYCMSMWLRDVLASWLVCSTPD